MRSDAILAVSPGTGHQLHAFGSEFTIHLGGQETGGKFCMFTEVTPPGGGPPPHLHRAAEEWFYPLEGRVEFFMDGSWQEVALGTTVYVPRGTVHTFRNPGDAPLRMLMGISPAGIETFFERCAEEFARPEPPEMERIAAIGADFGIEFVG